LKHGFISFPSKCGITDRPDLKGIETYNPPSLDEGYTITDRPDLKGIETQLSIRDICHGIITDRPDLKGIETF